jgi:hypothetical protein
VTGVAGDVLSLPATPHLVLVEDSRMAEDATVDTVAPVESVPERYSVLGSPKAQWFEPLKRLELLGHYSYKPGEKQMARRLSSPPGLQRGKLFHLRPFTPSRPVHTTE